MNRSSNVHFSGMVYLYGMILVTGSSGLVGSQVLVDLHLKGKKIRAMKRKASLEKVQQSFREAGFQDIPKEIEWIQADVLEVFSLQEAMQGIDEVYHCAGYVSFNTKDEHRMLQINVEGTANVVNAALEANVKKFCHISSIASLGRAASGSLMTEETHWVNSASNTTYAISKYSGEREVWRGIAEGLNAVIVNPSVIIGPGDWDKSSAKLFSSVWKGLPFYTEGINGYVDVRDVSKAMIQLMESDIKNERFILNSENYSYKNLFSEIAFALKKKAPSFYVRPWMSEIIWRLEAIRCALLGGNSLITKQTAKMTSGKFYYSNEKIKAAIGINFISVKDSVKHTAKIFLQQKTKKN